MNKIILNSSEINVSNNDDIIVSIEDKLDDYDIPKVNIKIIKSTNILMKYKNDSYSKYDVKIEVLDNICANIKEIKEEIDTKIQYKFYLRENSILNIDKFYDTKVIKELDIIYLDGKNATINYNFRNIIKNNTKYDIVIYHNNYNTKSNINNKCVTIDNGNVDLNVTSIIYNKIIGCNTTQNNKIINMNDSICKINPNLLIEEEDVIANHSAYIGKFDKDILFYMKSRGINESKAYKLLIKGFLQADEESEKIINKYWR